MLHNPTRFLVSESSAHERQLFLEWTVEKWVVLLAAVQHPLKQHRCPAACGQGRGRWPSASPLALHCLSATNFRWKTMNFCQTLTFFKMLRRSAVCSSRLQVSRYLKHLWRPCISLFICVLTQSLSHLRPTSTTSINICSTSGTTTYTTTLFGRCVPDNRTSLTRTPSWFK